MKKLLDSWLFQDHSKETVKNWAGQLKYFYFIRAWGGHANDGDSFTAAFINKDLKIQEGHTQILDYKVFVWITGNTLNISLVGKVPYVITEEDFQTCLEIEKEFDKLGWQSLVDKKIEENICCVSKSKYPELF